MARKVCVFLLLTAALVFAFSTGAEAARQSFGPFSVDVPRGWQIAETNNQLTFTAPDESAVLTIVVEEIEGTSLKAVAEAFAEEMGGPKPVAAEGLFHFTYEEDGVKCNAIVQKIDGTDIYTVIVAAGEHPELEGMLESFETAN